MESDESVQPTALPPDDAFALLGNETRMEILQALSRMDTPVSFSELNERVGVADSGQFNYHLDKLVGHFVRHDEAGYSLRRAGERVIEAVLSGAVTDAPVVEPSETDETCPFCGGQIEVSFTEERVEFYCTTCPGLYRPSAAQEAFDVEDLGFLGRLSLPPAGLLDRTPQEIVEAARKWGELEVMSMSTGLCPRCSADLERSIEVCESHDATEGLCETCGRRYAANIEMSCTNCIFEAGGIFSVALAASTEYLEFLATHGINPLTPQWTATTYEEEIRSVEPFEATFTFTIDGDTRSITVDEDLQVTDVTDRPDTASR